MTYQFEARVSFQVQDVLLGSGKEVIQADHFMTFIQQAFTQVRTQKASTTGYQNLLFDHVPVPCICLLIQQLAMLAFLDYVFGFVVFPHIQNRVSHGCSVFSQRPADLRVLC